MKKLLLLTVSLTLIIITVPKAQAQEPATVTSQSNQNSTGNISATVTARACVKVGAPTDPKPAACNQPASNFTSVPGAGGFVHYCQNNNPPWPTGNGCTLGASGCGPTSLAMAMSTFNAVCDGGTCNPAAVNKLMEAAGQRQPACNSVVNGGAVASQWFKNAGMEIAPNIPAGGSSFNFEMAKQRINEGYLIIGSASNAPSCNCNHIFIIQDVDPATRSIHVRDPICRGANQETDFDDMYNNSIRSGNLDWLYAIPVKGVKLQSGVQ